MKAPPISWPGGKRFALTVIDDTDFATVDRTRPIYDALAAAGLRTTKTVWPLRSAHPTTGGETLEDREYLRWIRSLHDAGFEIALHGVADESSERGRIKDGLARFAGEMGADPSVHTNHTWQRNGLYWGRDRLDGPLGKLYGAYWHRRGYDGAGHQERTPWFWGDLCLRHCRYVRNFVWRGVNTLACDPLMPYHDPRRRYVRHWFSASDGAGVDGFCDLLSARNMDRLAASGGACICYTHFGTFPGVTPELAATIRRVGAMDGWYAPVSALLDHVGAERGWCDTSDWGPEYLSMQRRWALSRMMH